MNTNSSLFNEARKMVYDILDRMYIDIYIYLSFLSTNSIHNGYKFVKVQNKYAYVREILDKILKYQDDINEMIKDPICNLSSAYFKSILDFTYNESVESILDKLEPSNRDKFTRYQSSKILDEETNQLNLLELLREDAMQSNSKEAKKYFEIFDEEYGMTIDNYLFYHDIPEKKEDLSDEQAVIKDMIEGIFKDLQNYLSEYYFEIFQYIFNQDDFSYSDISDKMNRIMTYKDKINYIMDIYLYEGSSLLKYRDPEKINEEVFKERINFFKEYDNSLDESKVQSYKDVAIDSNSYFIFDIYQLLENDAWTDESKKYFNKGE